MWLRDMKWANTFGKMMLIEVLNVGLPKSSICKKVQYLWNTIKQNTIKQGMPVQKFILSGVGVLP